MDPDQFLPPVRCFTCNKVIGGLYERYQNYLAQGASPEEAFNLLGVKRYCCRTNLMNPAVLPAGVLVEGDDDITQLQRKLEMLQVQAPMQGVLPAMTQRTGLVYPGRPGTIEVNPAPKSVRIYPGVQGTSKMRRPLTYDELVQILQIHQLNPGQIETLLYSKGVTPENARRNYYYLDRSVPGQLNFEVSFR